MSRQDRKKTGKAEQSKPATGAPPPAGGSSGISSGLQPGGMCPAGGTPGGFGSIGTGGGSTGPDGATGDAGRKPTEK